MPKTRITFFIVESNKNMLTFKHFISKKKFRKDKEYAYTEDFQKLVPIVGVDAKTFEYLNFDTLNHSWSKDKNHYYIDYKKINVDYSTFTF